MQSRYSFVILLAVFFFGGCSVDPEEDNSILYEDAAESISAAVGDQSGGALENFADVMIAGGEGNLGSSEPQMVMDGSDRVAAGVPVYDSLTGWWSVSVQRTFTGEVVERSITREYRFQFQKNGTPQKRFVTGTDTATTLKFKVVSGSGYFRGPRVRHALTQLSGAWTSHNINTPTVTITLDSTYVRSGSDTVVTRSMSRTLTSTLKITSMQLTAPRYTPANHTLWRNRFHQDVSGTIGGNYSASITFQRGDAYKERTIDRDFTITLGDGNGSLSISGGGSFGIDLQQGMRR